MENEATTFEENSQKLVDERLGTYRCPRVEDEPVGLFERKVVKVRTTSREVRRLSIVSQKFNNPSFGHHSELYAGDDLSRISESHTRIYDSRMSFREESTTNRVDRNNRENNDCGEHIDEVSDLPTGKESPDEDRESSNENVQEDALEGKTDDEAEKTTENQEEIEKSETKPLAKKRVSFQEPIDRIPANSNKRVRQNNESDVNGDDLRGGESRSDEKGRKRNRKISLGHRNEQSSRRGRDTKTGGKIRKMENNRSYREEDRLRRTQSLRLKPALKNKRSDRYVRKRRERRGVSKGNAERTSVGRDTTKGSLGAPNSLGESETTEISPEMATTQEQQEDVEVAKSFRAILGGGIQPRDTTEQSSTSSEKTSRSTETGAKPFFKAQRELTAFLATASGDDVIPDSLISGPLEERPKPKRRPGGPRKPRRKVRRKEDEPDTEELVDEIVKYVRPLDDSLIYCNQHYVLIGAKERCSFFYRRPKSRTFCPSVGVDRWEQLHPMR